MENGGGVKSYDREKARPSLNHSILSAEVGEQESGKDHINPSEYYFSMILYCSVDCGLLPVSHFVIRGGGQWSLLLCPHTRHTHVVVCNRQIYNIRQSFSGGLSFHSIAVFRA
jgi:hypothetical protein